MIGWRHFRRRYSESGPSAGALHSRVICARRELPMSLRRSPVPLLVVTIAALSAHAASAGINRVANGSFDEAPDPTEWQMVGDAPIAANAADATSCAPDS